ncbi:MAG: hypothetical protein IKE05_02410 [Clostridia bacterium]|nr:hypothetical protein [Clostridia bacterium]
MYEKSSGTENNYFDSAIYFLDEKIKNSLMQIPENIKKNAQEIRLRLDKPVCIVCSDKNFFIKNSGLSLTTQNYHDNNILKIDKNTLEKSFYSLCEYSVYSFENQISNGFITAKGGHRIGLCGTAVIKNGEISGIREITSINIRIAKEFFGCSSGIMAVLNKALENTLIIGPPASGKTSILRDIARNISLGINIQKSIKTVIIDERCEIAGVSSNTSQFDIGLCDVMNAFPKSVGIEMAVRCLSPECIICDEIGGENDMDELIKCANCGVNLIASVHAKNKDDFFRKNISKTLISKCGFENLVFLGSGQNAGKINQILKASDFKK